MGREKSKSVVIPLSDKVLEIESDPIPRKMRELRSFFASTNQIIKFVPNLASLESPLRTLLNKKSTISRSDVYNMAFENIKSKIINKTENKYFVVKLNTREKSGASHNGIGATLEQLHDNDWRSVFFASRLVKPHEAKNSLNALKLLGVV